MKKDELYFKMMTGLSLAFLFFLNRLRTLPVLSLDRRSFVLYSLSLLSLILIIVLFFLRRRKKNAGISLGNGKGLFGRRDLF